ncbi:MAG: VOC family protein [Gemmatimonadetes bacterium]|nr:VOC family protein [Gemmatimonadota bacterium]
MGLRDSYPTGTFCWIHLNTTDADSARTYYSELFGWTFTDPDTGALQDLAVAGLRGMGTGEGDTSFWLSFISVESADAMTQKAEGLGAHVLAPPFDVGSSGRMAVMQDPVGAVFAVWEPGEEIGARIVNQHGTLCWNELITTDAEVAGTFYSTLFDWTVEPYGDSYTVFINGDRPAGGLLTPDDASSQESSQAPAHWLVYFNVDDCDAVLERSNALGGGVRMPPDDWPEVGRGAVLIDPQGATFGAMFLQDPPD